MFEIEAYGVTMAPLEWRLGFPGLGELIHEP
jgi:hypothetical protein